MSYEDTLEVLLMQSLTELPLPEGDRKEVWAVKTGSIQVPSRFLLLLDRACLLTTCSSDESGENSF